MNASEEFFVVKEVVSVDFHMLTLLKTRLGIWGKEETPMRAGSGEQDA